MTLNVASITPKNIKEGMIGSLGKVVDKITSFAEFVSLDVFVSVFFTFEVTDSGICSIFIL